MTRTKNTQKTKAEAPVTAAMFYEFKEEVGQRFSATDQRFDKIETKIDNLALAVNKDFHQLNITMENHNHIMRLALEKLGMTDERVDSHESRITKIEDWDFFKNK